MQVTQSIGASVVQDHSLDHTLPSLSDCLSESGVPSAAWPWASGIGAGWVGLGAKQALLSLIWFLLLSLHDSNFRSSFWVCVFNSLVFHYAFSLGNLRLAGS